MNETKSLMDLSIEELEHEAKRMRLVTEILLAYRQIEYYNGPISTEEQEGE